MSMGSRFQLVIRIRHKFRGLNREHLSRETRTVYPETSYESVEAMQEELLRRFPNRENVLNRKVKNGIVRIEGNRLDHSTSVVTMERR